MEVIHLNFTKELGKPLAIALGYFDGLHLGHQAYKKCSGLCEGESDRSAVMTFSPSPNIFFEKIKSAPFINTLSGEGETASSTRSR